VVAGATVVGATDDAVVEAVVDAGTVDAVEVKVVSEVEVTADEPVTEPALITCGELEQPLAIRAAAVAARVRRRSAGAVGRWWVVCIAGPPWCRSLPVTPCGVVDREHRGSPP
jgi:hypothetical protein